MEGDASTEKARRIEVRYEGRVQGVGFRYTALDAAGGLAVTGYVENEPDGSVLLVAEGKEADLSALLRRIRETHLGRYIAAERVRWFAPSDEFRGFRIRHGY